MFESVSPEININLDADWTPEELDKIAKTFETLSAYAKLKASAMRYRLAGNIEDAIMLEKQCNVTSSILVFCLNGQNGKENKK